METGYLISILKDLLLAVIQGVAEIFPVSSSGHLILFSGILGNQLTFQEILLFHIGALFAIAGYYWQDLRTLPKSTEGRQLAGGIAMAFLVSGLVGLAFRAMLISDIVKSPQIAAGSLLMNGVILLGFSLVSQRANLGRKKLAELGFLSFMLLGIFQGIATVPGISRLGMTLGLGLVLGLSWVDALKLSFLLSLPTLLFANLYEIAAQFFETQNSQPAILVAQHGIFFGAPSSFHQILAWTLIAIFSCLAAAFALKILLKYMSQPLLNYFGLYCFVAGIFYWLYFKYF